MTYTKKQFLEDVAKEARALKKHATPEELDKLDFSNLWPNDVTLCVYGQMTGYCDSPRASELIKICANKFFIDSSGDFIYEKEFEEFRWSPLERYITHDDAQNKNLIAFLKGERKDLVL